MGVVGGEGSCVERPCAVCVRVCGMPGHAREQWRESGSLHALEWLCASVWLSETAQVAADCSLKRPRGVRACV